MAMVPFGSHRQRSADQQQANDRRPCPPNASPTMRAAHALRDVEAIRLEHEINRLMRQLVASRSPEIESQIRALRRIRNPKVVQLGIWYRMQEVKP